VEDHVPIPAGVEGGLGVGDVALQGFGPHGLDRGVALAGQHEDAVSTLAQNSHQRLSQEPSAPDDQAIPHREANCPAAQTASSSRWILALWRGSTGRPGWKRTRRMAPKASCSL